MEKQTVQDQMIAKDLEIKKVRFTFRFMRRGSVAFEVTLLYFAGKEKDALLRTHGEETEEMCN